MIALQIERFEQAKIAQETGIGLQIIEREIKSLQSFDTPDTLNDVSVFDDVKAGLGSLLSTRQVAFNMIANAGDGPQFGF